MRMGILPTAWGCDIWVHCRFHRNEQSVDHSISPRRRAFALVLFLTHTHTHSQDPTALHWEITGQGEIRAHCTEPSRMQSPWSTGRSQVCTSASILNQAWEVGFGQWLPSDYWHSILLSSDQGISSDRRATGHAKASSFAGRFLVPDSRSVSFTHIQEHTPLRSVGLPNSLGHLSSLFSSG